MLSLKNHPFAVETTFATSLVLTYAVPKSELEKLLPECLELDCLNDEWGFVAVALVDTKKLRPKGFPRFLGNDFVLVGFRVFVRYTNKEGKRLRGLYILKSVTNMKSMSFLGNIFTHYQYTTSDISFENNGNIVTVSSVKDELEIEVQIDEEDILLPAGSPFKDWKEARRFAGPLPFTFTYNPIKKEVLIIEGVRENWTPRAVRIIKSRVGYLEQAGFKVILPANAFVIEQVPYYWKKGKTEIWS